MSQINISSHDYLGKLSVIKNALFLLREKATGQLYTEKDKELLEIAYSSTEDLIRSIKETSFLQKSTQPQETSPNT